MSRRDDKLENQHAYSTSSSKIKRGGVDVFRSLPPRSPRYLLPKGSIIHSLHLYLFKSHEIALRMETSFRQLGQRSGSFFSASYSQDIIHPPLLHSTHKRPFAKMPLHNFAKAPSGPRNDTWDRLMSAIVRHLHLQLSSSSMSKSKSRRVSLKAGISKGSRSVAGPEYSS